MKTITLTLAMLGALTSHALTLTPPQTEGPFYPRGQFVANSSDLTQSFLTQGELLVIDGQVIDEDGLPMFEAVVQIWQTDGLTGRYLVENSDKPFDSYFNYHGETHVDFLGQYSFTTVRPIEYEANEDWVRPDHIHVKVLLKGKEVLTTQLYFSDDMELINKDRILQRLTEAQRKALIVDLFDSPEHTRLAGRSVKKGAFKIVLDKTKNHGGILVK